jgi:hypothetical protein
VANHRRQSINKAHSIPYLKSLEKRLGAIQSCLHYIQPSIGVGFKILVGAPLFFPLDGQTKGGVVSGTTPLQRKEKHKRLIFSRIPLGIHVSAIW